ncbi:MAG: hypothetical protein ACI8Z9_001555 [Paraglaciecola sp.]|jgi:hypothetical protein
MDVFYNPVGCTIFKGLQVILRELTSQNFIPCSKYVAVEMIYTPVWLDRCIWVWYGMDGLMLLVA